MAELLKHQFFTPDAIQHFAETIFQHHPAFDRETFTTRVFADGWEAKELKARMRHVTICLHETLSLAYADALGILKLAAPAIKGFDGLCLPDYVERYGREDWERSLPALGYFTKFASSEFAIRPFLDQDPDRVMPFLLQWAEDDDQNVRRFASEGCRPRLPWSMALPKFKRDPRPILPVLEKLKADESEFVRKSVANNLNDISKDHPDLLLDLCERWQGQDARTDWILKHACRTLLKAGNPRALGLFGHNHVICATIEEAHLDNTRLSIGETARFSFTLNLNEPEPANVRLEYAVYFVKANRQVSKKVFKITENVYEPGTYPFSKRHAFVERTTRKHYPGKHRITIIVNGDEKAEMTIELQ
ncbi:hypothetical protein U14_01753 [Candidatus Moduliflexus flocculans]|uniref:DNA alkylation repair protein n=1 Tax=Candidatus Moduliflexus flocculans TaxID=1499966 RepID=A0A0S6VSR1_9BACT|nr:hypothetical protein U14_01753 [Candidatus Moduliflexus flocculans]